MCFITFIPMSVQPWLPEQWRSYRTVGSNLHLCFRC